MSGSLGAASLNELFHRRAYELLKDGAWHDLEPIISELGLLVPPGMAMRKAEQSRINSTRFNERGARPVEEVGPRVKPRTDEQLIRSGRREVVRPLFAKSTHGATPWVKLRTKADGVRQVRLLRKTRVIIGDERRAEVLRPPLSSLAATFTAQGLEQAAEQVQLTAHEYGFHLSSCPKDCSLVRLSPQRWVPGQDVEEELPD